MKMMMMERMARPNRRSEYAGDDGRRMIGFSRDQPDREYRREYMPENRNMPEEYGMPRNGGMPHNPYERGYPMQMRGGNSYGDIYAHGTIWAPGAMNKPEMMGSRQESEDHRIDEHTARDWVQRMAGGEHFKPDQSEQFRVSMCPECDKWEFYAAMNAARSDYHKTAQKTGLDRPEFYAMLAADFLNDKDAKPNKLARYMREIAK